MQKKKININRDNLLALLGSEHFLIVDKRILRLYGPATAMVLINLIDFYKYLKTIKRLDADEWFYCTHKQQQEHLNITLDALRNSKNVLIQDNILNVKRKGIPAKEWYYINIETLIDKLDTVSEVLESSKTEPLVIGKTDDLSSDKPMTIYKERKYILRPEAVVLPLIALADKDKQIVPNIFDRFWNIYPKKTDQGKAKTAWDKLCKKKDRPTWKVIKSAILSQMKSDRWQDKQFIPLATTWINQSRWLDDPEEMIVFKRTNNETKRAPKYYDGIAYNYDPTDGLYKNRAGDAWF